MTNTPAGWYSDPENATNSRWWDGTQWTEHRSAPAVAPASVAYTTQDAASLKAPAGTQTNTAWVWLIIVLPILPILALLTIDWGSMFDFSEAGSSPSAAASASLNMMGAIFSPGYFIALFGGWVAYGLCAWFAYLDWKELARRGVPKPFHWAWTFLYSVLYVIGRSVVVRRRTGQGSAPMWAAIASIVVITVIVTYLMVVMMSAAFSSMSQIALYNYDH